MIVVKWEYFYFSFPFMSARIICYQKLASYIRGPIQNSWDSFIFVLLNRGLYFQSHKVSSFDVCLRYICGRSCTEAGLCGRAPSSLLS